MERKNYTDALIESLEEAVRDDKGNIQMQFDDYDDNGELTPEIQNKFNKLDKAKKAVADAKVAHDQAKAEYEANLIDIGDRYIVKYVLSYPYRDTDPHKEREERWAEADLVPFGKTVFDLAAPTHDELLVANASVFQKNGHSVQYVLFYSKDDAERFYALLPDTIVYDGDRKRKVAKCVEQVKDWKAFGAESITRSYSAATKNGKINKLGFTLPTGEAFKADTWEFDGNHDDIIAFNKDLDHTYNSYDAAQRHEERTMDKLFKPEPKEKYVEVDGQRFNSAKDLWNYMLSKNK